MTEEEKSVLREMREEWAYPFRMLAERSGVPEAQVRKIVRRFHDNGWCCYGPLFDEDTGMLAGTGYSLSARGLEAQEDL